MCDECEPTPYGLSLVILTDFDIRRVDSVEGTIVREKAVGSFEWIFK